MVSMTRMDEVEISANDLLRHYIPGGTPDWPADKIEKLMAEHCPLKRCAVPEDVARVVAFLASEDGGWVNGISSSVP